MTVATVNLGDSEGVDTVNIICCQYCQEYYFLLLEKRKAFNSVCVCVCVELDVASSFFLYVSTEEMKYILTFNQNSGLFICAFICTTM